MADAFIEQLKEQIAHYRSMLEPLESGRLRIGEARHGSPWTDRTKVQIDASSVIAMLEFVRGARLNGPIAPKARSAPPA